MAAEEEDKTEEPTQKRIDDARKKGDIVYSTEVSSAFSLLAATFVIATMGGPVAQDRGAILNARPQHKVSTRDQVKLRDGARKRNR